MELIVHNDYQTDTILNKIVGVVNSKKIQWMGCSRSKKNITDTETRREICTNADSILYQLQILNISINV